MAIVSSSGGEVATGEYDGAARDTDAMTLQLRQFLDIRYYFWVTFSGEVICTMSLLRQDLGLCPTKIIYLDNAPIILDYTPI